MSMIDTDISESAFIQTEEVTHVNSTINNNVQSEINNGKLILQ